MGVFNFLTGKKNTTLKRQFTPGEIEELAAQKARQATGRKYGQTKVANILITPKEAESGLTQANIAKGRKVNEWFKIRNEERTRLNKFNYDLAKELRSYGSQDQVKTALTDVIAQLDQGLAAAAGGGRGGADSVTITIPRLVAKLLKGILKIILFSVTILFTIAIVLMGANANSPANIGSTMLAAQTLESMGSMGNNSRRTEREVEEWGEGGRRRTRRNRRN